MCGAVNAAGHFVVALSPTGDERQVGRMLTDRGIHGTEFNRVALDYRQLRAQAQDMSRRLANLARGRAGVVIGADGPEVAVAPNATADERSAAQQIARNAGAMEARR